ncbi:MAG TPA: hypothetical protein VII68_01390 [Casimicrobiaceae bacterium]|jgi:hypothetical protein
MKTTKLSKTVAAMFAVASMSFASVALAATATTLSSDAYKAEKDRIDAAYKAEVAQCKSLGGNAKDVCEVTAKGHRDVAKAEAEASYKNTAKARYDARVAHVEANYKLAKEKCDDFAGNNKDVCIKEAKAAEVRGKADAKVDKVATEQAQDSVKKVAEAKADATQDKRDAEYKVAVEKCDALAGDAKSRCVADAKARFGRT